MSRRTRPFLRATVAHRIFVSWSSADLHDYHNSRIEQPWRAQKQGGTPDMEDYRATKILGKSSIGDANNGQAFPVGARCPLRGSKYYFPSRSFGD